MGLVIVILMWLLWLLELGCVHAFIILGFESQIVVLAVVASGVEGCYGVLCAC